MSIVEFLRNFATKQMGIKHKFNYFDRAADIIEQQEQELSALKAILAFVEKQIAEAECKEDEPDVAYVLHLIRNALGNKP